jgi:hypothetical protein
MTKPELLRRHVSKRARVLDVGANVGPHVTGHSRFENVGHHVSDGGFGLCRGCPPRAPRSFLS